MRISVASVVLLWSAALWSAPADLAVARRALGDGLWEIAARHAAAAAADAKDASARTTARLVELEALAGAGRAAEVQSRLEGWTDAQGERFRYWRAWAAVETGHAEEALALLEKPFAEQALTVQSLRLVARISVASGDRKSAVELFGKASEALASNVVARTENAMEWARALDGFGAASEAVGVLRKEGAVETPGPTGDAARLLAAELLEKTGDVKGGRDLRTRLVDGGTNTSERAYVLAACGLSESLFAAGSTNDALRVASNAVSRARVPALECQARFTLGFTLFACPGTRTEGQALVAETVRRFPENPFSDDAQLRLADGLLAAGDAEGAVRAYDVLLQSYPVHALDVHVLEGRGWALMRLGRRAEAVGLFARAAQVATNEQVKAWCSFKQGEALAEDGRFEEAAAVYGTVGAGELRVKARFNRADALQRARQKETALAEFSALFKEGGENAVDAGLRAAAIRSSLGQLEQAIEDYGNVVSKDAKRVPTIEQRVQALVGRGRAFYRAYRFRDAEKDFAAVAELQAARRDEMEFLKALCLYGDGRDREAYLAALHLLETVKDARMKGDLLLWLAKYDAGRREWEAAIGSFRACAELPESSGLRRVEAYVRAARCAASIPDYRQVVELTGNVATNVVAKESTAEMTYVTEALLLQGEALIELARFDAAVLVLEQVERLPAPQPLLRRAAVSRADCLFAMGAGDANRYRGALDGYRAVLRLGDDLTDSMRIAVAYKLGLTLEKMRRLDEAADHYYQNVVLAYWDAVRPDAPESARRRWFDGTARDLFARSVLKLADYYESRGDDPKMAVKVLGYLVAARMPASEQAARRIARLKEKGGLR